MSEWVTLELCCGGISSCGIDRALLLLERQGYEVDRERAKVKVDVVRELGEYRFAPPTTTEREDE